MFITIAAILVILVLGGYLLMNALVLLIDFIERQKRGNEEMFSMIWGSRPKKRWR